ncbi:hypothetical protein COLO4_13961 [Corchorus olitorius]|uniref:Uncharacterized protein n=1 Tax=Corchorus olitorius TaxID=93759 RepID=A0A1R3JU58_9ROSI|nr:hypothetical protein COLO4_13961 [Corchorus olitorius]
MAFYSSLSYHGIFKSKLTSNTTVNKSCRSMYGSLGTSHVKLNDST